MSVLVLGSISCPFPQSDKTCVWHMGGPCSDDVRMVEVFDSQIEVPMCTMHLSDHRLVWALHKHGFDIEEVLDMNRIQREALASASGIEIVPWETQENT